MSDRLLIGLLGLLLTLVAGALALHMHGSQTWAWYWSPDLFADTKHWLVRAIVVVMLLRLLGASKAKNALLAATGVYLLTGLEPSVIAASTLVFACAYATGSVLLAPSTAPPRARAGATAATSLGLLLMGAVFGLLVHFPVNTRGLYIALLMAPPLLAAAARARRLAGSAAAARAAMRRWNAALEEIPYNGLAVLLLVVGWVARFTFLPSLGFDDNALHLRLWTEISSWKQGAFDVHQQVWALAPYALDLLQAVTSLVAGRDARSGVNLGLLLVLLWQLWAVARTIGLRPMERVWLLVLFASTPLLAYLLTSMQVELGLTALTVVAIRLLAEQSRGDGPDRSVSVLALLAIACAIKLTGVFLAGCLGLVLAWQWFTRGDRPPLCPVARPWVLPALVPVGCVVAFGAYAQSWLHTGNPVFPLYNAFFHSPLFANVNITDTTYAGHFSLSGFWNMFFATSQYNEASDYTAGFQYLALFPAAVALCLWLERDAWTWLLLLPVALYGFAAFHAMQYERYLFPVFPAASLLIARAFRTVRATAWPALAMATLTVGNLYFLPGVSWWLRAAPGGARTADGRASQTADILPTKTLTEWLNSHAPGATVLYPFDRPLGATLRGRPVYVDWYQPAIADDFKGCNTQEKIRRFLGRHEIQYVIWDLADSSSMLPAQRALGSYLLRHGYPVAQQGPEFVYRLHATDIDYAPAFALDGSGKPGDALPVAQQPEVVGHFKVGGASAARYRVRFVCRSKTGQFVAQINWNTGQPFYELVACSTEPVLLEKIILVPQGATAAAVYATARDDAQVRLLDLRIDLDKRSSAP